MEEKYGRTLYDFISEHKITIICILIIAATLLSFCVFWSMENGYSLKMGDVEIKKNDGAFIYSKTNSKKESIKDSISVVEKNTIQGTSTIDSCLRIKLELEDNFSKLNVINNSLLHFKGKDNDLIELKTDSSMLKYKILKLENAKKTLQCE